MADDRFTHSESDEDIELHSQVPNILQPTFNIVLVDDQLQKSIDWPYVVRQMLPETQVVHSAVNSRGALDKMDKNPQARGLVITDLMMPNSDGKSKDENNSQFMLRKVVTDPNAGKIDNHGGFKLITIALMQGSQNNFILGSAGNIGDLFQEFIKLEDPYFVKLLTLSGKNITTVNAKEKVKEVWRKGLEDNRIMAVLSKTRLQDYDTFEKLLQMYKTGDYASMSREERIEGISPRLLKPIDPEEA